MGLNTINRTTGSKVIKNMGRLSADQKEWRESDASNPDNRKTMWCLSLALAGEKNLHFKAVLVRDDTGEFTSGALRQYSKKEGNQRAGKTAWFLLTV